MTAPTPEYLRALASAPNRLGDGWRISAVAALHQCADALAAVMAERDQAREALAADNKLGAFEAGKTIGAAEVRKERDQASQMLADAPHDSHCAWLRALIRDNPNVPCDCWKAGL